MRTYPSKQKGITIVEFSILASVFLLILFAIVEIGIFAFQLQSMNDLTRRTARISVVCPVGTAENIKTLALSENIPYGLFSGDEFTEDNLDIQYLDNAGNAIEEPALNQGQIHFIKTRIVAFNYGFSGLLNFLGDNGIVDVPEFETILPAESLGVLRIDGTDVKTNCM